MKEEITFSPFLIFGKLIDKYVGQINVTEVEADKFLFHSM